MGDPVSNSLLWLLLPALLLLLFFGLLIMLARGGTPLTLDLKGLGIEIKLATKPKQKARHHSQVENDQ